MLRKMLLFVLVVSATAFSQTVKFGIMGIGWPPQVLNVKYMLGPNGYGWQGSIDPLDNGGRADLDTVYAAGFKTIVGLVNRDSVVYNNWSSVQYEIGVAKSKGISWIYLDDGQIDNGSSNPDSVSVDQINTLATYVHQAGLLLASSTYNFPEMQAEPEWWSNVDIIFPYDYGVSSSDYNTFLSNVHTLFPNKGLVPFLGYNTGSPSYPDETGNLGGGTGHIEIAETYANLGIVFYWISWPSTDITNDLNYLYKLTNYLQMYYGMSGTPAPVGVQLDQKTQEGARVGTLGVWNSSSFTSHSPGDTVFLTRTSNQTIQGDVNVYSGEKYNNWTRKFTPEATVLNYHVFSSISVNDSIFTSNFVPTVGGVTIQNNLIDAASLTTNVGFSDPWFIDYSDPNYGGAKRNEGMSAPFISRASPFQPNLTNSYGGNKYLGVFTNQSGPPKWDPPYYSISFPSQSVSVGGTNHSLYFLNWSATGATLQNQNSAQTPVVFTSSSATVTANVKGSLLSSVSSASGYGNQSSIVRDYQGNLDMVYASAGEIWYTKSTDNGQTWSPEVRISAGDGYARNPSITQWYFNGTGYPNAFEVCVVWVDAYQAFLGFSYNVFYRVLDLNSNSWGSIGTVDDPPSGGVGHAKPDSRPAATLIMSGGYQYITVAFEGAGTGILIMSQNPYDTWYSETLSSTDTTCGNPELFTTDYSSLGGFLMYLTYDDGYDVCMAYSRNPTPSSGTPSFSAPYEINSGIECSENTSLGITVDGAGTVRFTWRGFDPLYYYQYAIWERSLSWAGWEWSSPVEFAGYSDFDEPSICGHVNSDYGATIMFHDETSTNPVYEVMSDNGGSSWSGGPGNPGLQITTNASYPNLPSTSDPADIPFVLTATNTTPYALEPGMRNDSAGTGGLYKEGAAGTGLRFSQVVQVVDTTRGLAAAFDLSNVQVSRSGAATVSAKLVQTSLDSSRGSVISITPSLSGSLANAGTYLTFYGNLDVKMVHGSASVALALEDSGSNIPLMNLLEQSVVDSLRHRADSSFSVGIPPGMLQTNPKLAVLVDGKPDTTARLMLVNVYFLNDSSHSNGGGYAPASIPLPTNYNLSQNYPNPFNPTTTIDYALPVSGYVTLRIYDVLGREVRTLVNGDEPAGYDNVVFDASTLPSGVYFYRITAGKFTSVKKLVLIK